MVISKELLLNDLHIAFIDAANHKYNKPYVLNFLKNLSSNLSLLRDDLFYRVYKPEPSTVFILECPVKREIFAAAFRDRIVQHLYFNYLHKLFENTFIQDCYSCITGRGTSYGVKRLIRHILQESQNYSKQCYYLKMDITGYFMNINRETLLNIVLKLLSKFKVIYDKHLDFDLLTYMSKEIIIIDPIINSRFIGDLSDYNDLPLTKTLLGSPDNCGLPIGNLTSQLFSNVYMNLFDQFMKRTLKCKHYGRYVDDFYVISTDKDFLISILGSIQTFLTNTLGLTINKKKTVVKNITYGVEFLGAFIKPYRAYISNKAYKRIKIKNRNNRLTYIDSFISYVGSLNHYKSFKLKKELIRKYLH